MWTSSLPDLFFGVLGNNVYTIIVAIVAIVLSYFVGKIEDKYVKLIASIIELIVICIVLFFLYRENNSSACDRMSGFDGRTNIHSSVELNNASKAEAACKNAMNEHPESGKSTNKSGWYYLADDPWPSNYHRKANRAAVSVAFDAGGRLPDGGPCEHCQRQRISAPSLRLGFPFL